MDHLLDRGLTCVTVLDVSAAALARARRRLGTRGDRVRWIEADVTDAWEVAPVDVWHDRAVLHFLTAREQRDAYVQNLRQALKSRGSAVIGAFALDGPQACSGLPVQRYSPEALAALMGSGFDIAEAVRHVHDTPAGGRQSFTFARLLRN